MTITCPACRAPGPHSVRRRYTLDEAMARYGAVVRGSTPDATAEKRDRLRRIIRERWQGESVDILECEHCRFWFVVPYVDAGAEFFALYMAAPTYPKDRWEFGVVRELIRHHAQATQDPKIRVLDVGGGDGSFVRSLLADRELGARVDPVVCDFSATAVQRLQQAGIEAGVWTPDQMLANPRLAGSCDFVCTFHCVDEIADLDALFAACLGCLRPGASLLLSVKNGESEEYDERVYGITRMPPIFITNWYPSSIRALAARHGFEVVNLRHSNAKSRAEIWNAARQRAFGTKSITGHLIRFADRIPNRTIRGAIKQGLTLMMWPLVAFGRNSPPPSVLLAHLRRPA